MTKRVIIPDMHCNIEWVKNILKRESPNIVIMLGDYFDSFDPDLYNNSPNSFKELLKIKEDFIKENGENSFITLLGNHDFHYLYDVLEQYSGFSWRLSEEISPLINLEFEKHNLPIVYIDETNKIIFSHAGVTNTWMKDNNINSIYDINNTCFKYPNVLMFTYKNSGDMYGDSISSSPIWVRPNSLLKDKVKDWVQVVGHTEYITKNNNYYLKDNCYFIDNSQDTYMIQELDNNVLTDIKIKTIQ